MKSFIFILITSIFLSNCAAKLTDSQSIRLKKDLEEMVKVDQVATNLPKGKYLDYTEEQWNRFRDSVQTDTKIRVEEMFDTNGFLGYSKVGKEGSKHFWLLVQHSDKYSAFQKKVLKAMNKEVKKGNTSPSDYAYLYDRVKVNAGEKQKFGTQLDFDKTGKPFPKIGLMDSAKVDKLRKTYGLEPLQDYYNFYMDYYRKQRK